MENQILLEIVKKSILGKFDDSIIIDKNQLLEKYPFLNEQKACFVTLNLDGELRGCIGSLQAFRSLLDDLISNSYGAAFEDPRFYELTLKEFEKIEIEISILTTPKEVIYENIEDLKTKITPYKDGVILQRDGRRSTFLPQVWEQLSDFEDFFNHLCYKGNFEENCLESHPDVLIYQVNKIKESQNEH